MKYLQIPLFLLLLNCNQQQKQVPDTKTKVNKLDYPISMTLSRIDTTEILMTLFNGIKMADKNTVLWKDSPDTNNTVLDSNSLSRTFIRNILATKDGKKVILFATKVDSAPHVAGQPFGAACFSRINNKWKLTGFKKYIDAFGEFGVLNGKVSIEDFGGGLELLKVESVWLGGGSEYSADNYYFPSDSFEEVFSCATIFGGMLKYTYSKLKHIKSKNPQEPDKLKLISIDKVYSEFDDLQQHPKTIATKTENFIYDPKTRKYIEDQNKN